METRKTVSLDEFWDISIKPKTLNLNSMSEEELKAEIEKGYKKPTVKDTGATDPEEILYFLSHGFKPKLLSKSELDAIKVANDEVINDKLNNIESKSGEISDKYNPDQMKKATLVEGEIAFAISEATGIPVRFDGQAVENFNIGDHNLFEMKNDEASEKYNNLFVEISARTNSSTCFHFGSATNILCEKENYSKYLATKCFQDYGKDEVIYIMNREALSRFLLTAATWGKTVKIKSGTAVGARHPLEEADRLIATEEGCLKLKKEDGRWVIDPLDGVKKEIFKEWRQEKEADKKAGKVTTLAEQIETISHEDYENFYKLDAVKEMFKWEELKTIEKIKDFKERQKELGTFMEKFSEAKNIILAAEEIVGKNSEKLEKLYTKLQPNSAQETVSKGIR